MVKMVDLIKSEAILNCFGFTGQFKVIFIQSNFNGSNTFGTMNISLRQA